MKIFKFLLLLGIGIVSAVSPAHSEGAIEDAPAQKTLREIDIAIEFKFAVAVKVDAGDHGFYLINGKVIRQHANYKPKAGDKVCAFSYLGNPAVRPKELPVDRIVFFAEFEGTESDIVYRTLRKPLDPYPTDEFIAAVQCFEVVERRPNGLVTKTLVTPSDLRGALSPALTIKIMPKD
ncbi:MAG TPA: hypothetical protein VM901_07685 [Bdellovibrionota bacterium]|jgi:hypothetical protein|nr:hypothetical protein [Bdellovibrionota bacterium]